MKDLFEYTDYRQYLKDFYADKKENTAYFSFRYFSNKAGFGSPSFLKFIMDGERNLSSDGVEKFVVALGLSQRRAAYFRLLVRFNQEKEEKAKNKYFRDLIALTPGALPKNVDKSQYEFYSQWYYSGIRELVTLPGFKEDPAWIATALHPNIKPKEARNALELLLTLGFLKRNKSGKLIQADPVITTGREVSGLSIRNFHRQMISLAGESIESVAPSKREVSGMTLCLSEKMIQEIKDRVSAFQDDLLESVSKDETPSEHIYQLNFQFFPICSTSVNGSKKGRE